MLAELANRIRHVVFLAAVVPPDATRVLVQIDPRVRVFVEQAIIGGIYRQDREAAQAMLCNDLDPKRSAWLLGRITPDSAALLTEFRGGAGRGGFVVSGRWPRSRPVLRA